MLKKLKNLKKKKATFLFVSHNMNLFKDLCEKAILLDKGEIIKYDDCKSIVECYLKINI